MKQFKFFIIALFALFVVSASAQSKWQLFTDEVMVNADTASVTVKLTPGAYYSIQVKADSTKGNPNGNLFFQKTCDRVDAIYYPIDTLVLNGAGSYTTWWTNVGDEGGFVGDAIRLYAITGGTATVTVNAWITTYKP